MALSEDQIKKYLKQGGVNCPYCGSSNIEGDSFDVDAGNVYQDIRCLECDKEWCDEYSLTGIQEDEG